MWSLGRNKLNEKIPMWKKSLSFNGQWLHRLTIDAFDIVIWVWVVDSSCPQVDGCVITAACCHRERERNSCSIQTDRLSLFRRFLEFLSRLTSNINSGHSLSRFSEHDTLIISLSLSLSLTAKIWWDDELLTMAMVSVEEENKTHAHPQFGQLTSEELKIFRIRSIRSSKQH